MHTCKHCSVAYVADVTRRLEQGDLKLRVRVLESERAFARMELVQANLYTAVGFATFFNAALLLSSTVAPGAPLSWGARACWTLATAFGLKIPLGLLKVKACATIILVYQHTNDCIML
jgi:PIN domain nuclease of toxin-antitoxin system